MQEVVFTEQRKSLWTTLCSLPTLHVNTLLIGPSGSGKTFLANALAGHFNKRLVTVCLSATDANDVGGTFVSTTTPGFFSYKPSSLVTSLQHGDWVLLDEIDSASPETLAATNAILSDSSNHPDSFVIATARIKPKFSLIHHRFCTLTLPSLHPQTELPLVLSAITPSISPLSKQLANVAFEVFNLLVKSTSSRNNISFSEITNGICLWISKLSDLTITSTTQLSDDLIFKLTTSIDLFLIPTVFFKISPTLTLTPTLRKESLSIALHSLSLTCPTLLSNALSPPRLEFSNPQDPKLVMGRITLPSTVSAMIYSQNTSWIPIPTGLLCLEYLANCVFTNTPTLLVGEAGTGKTFMIQHLAKLLGKELVVMNLSNQTETSDLVGSLRPSTPRNSIIPLVNEFMELFKKTFSTKKNNNFIQQLLKCINSSQKEDLSRVISLCIAASDKAITKLSATETPPIKRKNNGSDIVDCGLVSEWNSLKTKFSRVSSLLKSPNYSALLSFMFIESSLICACKTGNWVLLDEANLASNDVLHKLISLIINRRTDQISLSELGGPDNIIVDPGFRLFAAINPATDTGKKPLPPIISEKFLPLTVPELIQNYDLKPIVQGFLGSVVKYLSIESIISVYQNLIGLAKSGSLIDENGNIPLFTLRSLKRVFQFVDYMVHNSPKSESIGNVVNNSVFNGFLFIFGGMLSTKCRKTLLALLSKALKPPKPSKSRQVSIKDTHVIIGDIKLPRGSHPPLEQPDYIITDTVWNNLINVARSIAIGENVLLQGETSVGKTSLIYYLAQLTGHRVHRINNHLHTDLSEYIGSYVSSNEGAQFQFKDGILVSALRNGDWILLDELNLAPSDVLEALNRLLDDNKELYVPETNEVIKPLPSFRLFATQNPPGLYGGRKLLSRAFRSRFVELTLPLLPKDELKTILISRTLIPLPPTHADILVNVMEELQRKRSHGAVFAGKTGLITLRDLFRWAGRGSITRDDLCYHGICLLAEKCRDLEDKRYIVEVLQKICRVKLSDTYLDEKRSHLLTSHLIEHAQKSGIVLTKPMKRVVELVLNAYSNKEAVLLIGGTGTGKTSCADFIATFLNNTLIHVSIHQHTDVVDLLGTIKPISTSTGTRFKFIDGPLIEAMQNGNHILLDEISLADDAVLERLNSVLEAERSLTVNSSSEDDSNSRFIESHDSFRIIATMNPAGDYGKKELSPALRNRFCEIWVPDIGDLDDIRLVITAKLVDLGNLASICGCILTEFFQYTVSVTPSSVCFSIRDLLAWTEFLLFNSNKIPLEFCLLHGACIAIIDTIPIRAALSTTHATKLTDALLSKLTNIMSNYISVCPNLVSTYKSQIKTPDLTHSSNSLKLSSFSIPFGSHQPKSPRFVLSSPTPFSNALRVTRALSLNRPILVEGPPGAGKTSLISALADFTGNSVARINFSEHSDLLEIIGSFVPNPNNNSDDNSPDFFWSDGILLTALKEGSWVILDEINLAPQQVLEGLNSILDHRRSIFVPEINDLITAHPNFKIFACQNPLLSGGGRKGLPQSFLNRFVSVAVEDLKDDDIEIILSESFPIFSPILNDFSHFLGQIKKLTLNFDCLVPPDWPNLRDSFRFCDFLNYLSSNSSLPLSKLACISAFVAFGSCLTDSLAAQLVPLISQYFATKFPDPIEFYTALGVNILNIQFPKLKTILLNQHRPLFSILVSLFMQWPVLIEGQIGTGKTNLIELATFIYKTSLNDSNSNTFFSPSFLKSISLHPGTDVADLLGSYVQVSPEEEVKSLLTLIDSLVSTVEEYMVSKGNMSDMSNISSLHKEIKVELSSKIGSFDHCKSVITTDSHGLITQLLSQVDSLSLPHFPGIPSVDDIQSQADKLSKTVLSGGKFNWKLGDLASMVLSGEVVHLSDPNLCPPSVLDKLNALFERNGGLSESDLSPYSNDKFKIISPSEYFRAIITMDKNFGSPSPALLNRVLVVSLGFCDENLNNLSHFSLNKDVINTILLLNVYSKVTIPVDLFSIFSKIRTHYRHQPSKFEIFVKLLVHHYEQCKSWNEAISIVLTSFASDLPAGISNSLNIKISNNVFSSDFFSFKFTNTITDFASNCCSNLIFSPNRKRLICQFLEVPSHLQFNSFEDILFKPHLLIPSVYNICLSSDQPPLFPKELIPVDVDRDFSNQSFLYFFKSYLAFIFELFKANPNSYSNTLFAVLISPNSFPKLFKTSQSIVQLLKAFLDLFIVNPPLISAKILLNFVSLCSLLLDENCFNYPYLLISPLKELTESVSSLELNTEEFYNFQTIVVIFLANIYEFYDISTNSPQQSTNLVTLLPSLLQNLSGNALVQLLSFKSNSTNDLISLQDQVITSIVELLGLEKFSLNSLETLCKNLVLIWEQLSKSDSNYNWCIQDYDLPKPSSELDFLILSILCNNLSSILYKKEASSTENFSILREFVFISTNFTIRFTSALALAFTMSNLNTQKSLCLTNFMLRLSSISNPIIYGFVPLQNVTKLLINKAKNAPISELEELKQSIVTHSDVSRFYSFTTIDVLWKMSTFFNSVLGKVSSQNSPISIIENNSSSISLGITSRISHSPSRSALISLLGCLIYVGKPAFSANWFNNSTCFKNNIVSEFCSSLMFSFEFRNLLQFGNIHQLINTGRLCEFDEIASKIEVSHDVKLSNSDDQVEFHREFISFLNNNLDFYRISTNLENSNFLETVSMAIHHFLSSASKFSSQLKQCCVILLDLLDGIIQYLINELKDVKVVQFYPISRDVSKLVLDSSNSIRELGLKSRFYLSKSIISRNFSLFSEYLKVILLVWEVNEQERAKERQLSRILKTKTYDDDDSEEKQQLSQLVNTVFDHDYVTSEEFEGQEETTKTETTPPLLTDDDLVSLVVFCSSLTSNSCHCAESTISSNLVPLCLKCFGCSVQSSASLHYYLKVLLEFVKSFDNQFSSTAALAISTFLREGLNNARNHQSDLIDLWKDPAPNDLKMLFDAISPILNRTEELLKEYSDNAVLIDLHNTLLKVSKLPINTPIVNLIKSAELVINSCLEWDVLVPKIHKLSDYVIEISQLCQRWRKIELAHFKNILTRRLRQKQLPSVKLFFHLLKTIEVFSNVKNESRLAEFTETIYQFIDSAHLYDYELRLQLLVLIRNFAISTGYSDLVTNILGSVIQSRTIYLTRLQYILNRNIEPIATKLNEFLSVHEMSISDPIRIKQQMSKTLRQLSKSIGKFDSVVNIPFTQIIKQIEQLDTSHLTFKPNVYQSLESRFNVDSLLIEKSAEIDDFTTEVITQSNELSLLKSEDSSNDVQVKIRALSALLNHIKKLPLYSKSVDIVEIHSSFIEPNTITDSFISKTETYFWNFYRRLRLLQGIKPHDDVTSFHSSYLQQSGHLFNSTCLIRRFVSQLENIISYFEPLEAEGCNFYSCNHAFNHIFVNFESLSSVLIQFSFVYENNTALLSNDLTTKLNSFVKLTNSVLDFMRPKVQFRIFTEFTVNRIEKFKGEVIQCLDEFIELIDGSILFKPFVDSLSSFEQIFTNTSLILNPSTQIDYNQQVEISSLDDVSNKVNALVSFSQQILSSNQSFSMNSLCYSNFLSQTSDVFHNLFIYHRTLSKCGYILTGLFLELSNKGFCKPQEEQPTEEQEQEMEGTGLGEGDTVDGAQDVTDELEDKEQLLGLEGEDQNETENQDQSSKGMDIEEDFDGTTSKGQDEQTEENDEKEQEQQNQEDKNDEFGDVEEEEDRMEGKADDDDSTNKEETGGKAEGEEEELAAKDEHENENEKEQGDEGNNDEGQMEMEEVDSEEEIEMDHNPQDNANHLSDPNDVTSDLDDVVDDAIDDVSADDDQAEGSEESDLEQVSGDEMEDTLNNEDDDENFDSSDKEEINYDPARDVMEQGQDGAEVSEQHKGHDPTSNDHKEEENIGGEKEVELEQMENGQDSNTTQSGKMDGSQGQQNTIDLERKIVENAVEMMKNLEILNNKEESNQNDESQEMESNDLYEFTSESHQASNAAAHEDQVDGVRKDDDEEDVDEDKPEGHKEEKNEDQNEELSEHLEQKAGLEKEYLNNSESKDENIKLNTELDEQLDSDTEQQGVTEAYSKELTDVNVDDDLLSTVESTMSTVDTSQDTDLFSSLALETCTASLLLAEKFRIILEPTLASKLKGDFRTGKRLNMKRIIPFIASNFKKDAIWLRRSHPSKRNFKILFAIDDSKSMKSFNADHTALVTLVLMTNALVNAEVGEVGALSFGKDVRIALPLTSSITSSLGSKMIDSFKFDQDATDMSLLVKKSVKFIETSNDDSRKLLFVISDGRFSNQEDVEKTVRYAHSKGVITVFLIIDSPTERDSITSLKSVTFPNGKLSVQSYLDSFPFPYYIVLRDVEALPAVVSSSLQQWLSVTSD
ncbi:hypothetical protein P9112_008645 [Eukaryota sp. TZLM1-RC]